MYSISLVDIEHSEIFYSGVESHINYFNQPALIIITSFDIEYSPPPPPPNYSICIGGDMHTYRGVRRVVGYFNEFPMAMGASEFKGRYWTSRSCITQPMWFKNIRKKKEKKRGGVKNKLTFEKTVNINYYLSAGF